MYFFIEPEVSGGFGNNAVIDKTVHPPIVSKLHYQFDGWLGDDLIETFPCYIVTEELAKELEIEKLSGISFQDVEISKSEQFEEIYPGKELPNFYWLKVDGNAGSDDFGIADDYRLTISERALAVLRKRKITEAHIEEKKGL